MNLRTILILIVSAFLAGTAGTTFADDHDQATEMNFAQPVRIPGQVLPAGTYWFKVIDSGSAGDVNRVEITNENGTKVIAQLQTATADKAQFGQVVKEDGAKWPSGKVIITVAEGAKDEPLTLLTWYYPGRPDGHRFVYSDSEQKQIDGETHRTLSFKTGETITIGRGY